MQQNMRFATTEGDELVFSKAGLSGARSDRALEALDGAVDFTRLETAAMTDQSRRVLGVCA